MYTAEGSATDRIIKLSGDYNHNEARLAERDIRRNERRHPVIKGDQDIPTWSEQTIYRHKENKKGAKTRDCLTPTSTAY